MIPRFIELDVDGLRLRISIRRPTIGQPIVRYHINRLVAGRERWVTIPACNAALLSKARSAFASEVF
ncbi:hypothetical protein [Neorhizobium sp. T25_27]|uniref:hypothetical protein n=1 Tax=Neorhizobium sp. T25_27 TaxID=2093831 RepID=UPI000CF97121|nr:hypothetical protein [Neorhizobium sp. T25_27]